MERIYRSVERKLMDTKPLVKNKRAKRVYQKAGIIALKGGFSVTLDGQSVLTPAGSQLFVKKAEFAVELAAEWNSQGAYIERASMPLNRIVNTAIDHVAYERIGVAKEVASYANFDLVCYRAIGPSGLIAKQEAAWNPLLDWIEIACGIKPATTNDIQTVPQDPKLISYIAARIKVVDDVTLASFAMATTIAGSVLIALAIFDSVLELQSAWHAAQIDEDWQIELWGEDTEAALRRANVKRDFKAAVQVMDFSHS
jgi:chaperone required for assembly of F1-ATPase